MYIINIYNNIYAREGIERQRQRQRQRERCNMVVRVENLNLENASILHIKYWSTILVPGTGTLPGTWYTGTSISNTLLWYQYQVPGSFLARFLLTFPGFSLFCFAYHTLDLSSSSSTAGTRILLFISHCPSSCKLKLGQVTYNNNVRFRALAFSSHIHNKCCVPLRQRSSPL